MASESIFHKLVKNEMSYSRLLCNMLKRDEMSRNAFFGLLRIDLSLLSDLKIAVEQHQEDGGRVDILISSTKLSMIVEVKTEVGTEIRPHQMLDDKAGYLRRLRKDAEKLDARFVFLVPQKWKLWDKKNEEIEGFNRDKDGKVKAQLISWEELTRELPKPDKSKKEISLTADFRMLLAERFGTVSFNEEEIGFMYSTNFQLETFLKITKLIDDLSVELGD